MSADNTVLVLRTPKRIGRGFEFRVAEVQAAENIHQPDGDTRERWLVERFAASPIFGEDKAYGPSAEEQAWSAAIAMASAARRKGCLENGVRSVALEEPFPDFFVQIE